MSLNRGLGIPENRKIIFIDIYICRKKNWQFFVQENISSLGFFNQYWILGAFFLVIDL